MGVGFNKAYDPVDGNFERGFTFDMRINEWPSYLFDFSQGPMTMPVDFLVFLVDKYCGIPHLSKLLAHFDIAADDVTLDGSPIEVPVRLVARDSADQPPRPEKSKGREWISSTEMCQILASDESSPWAEYGRTGKPITTAQLARLLAPFGIKPVQRWIDGRPVRGYWRHQFEDAWQRYLPQVERANSK